MKGYVLANMRDVPNTPPEVFEYIEKIQDTLDPFSGHFIIHGGATDVVEGAWDGRIAMIEFPSLEKARAWYKSSAYQAIVRLRADHLPSDVILVEGAEPDHKDAETHRAAG